LEIVIAAVKPCDGIEDVVLAAVGLEAGEVMVHLMEEKIIHNLFDVFLVFLHCHFIFD
jgi:hypothetical protein